MGYKHTDEEFISAFQQATSICNLLKLLGLKIYGGNYDTVRNRANKLGLTAEWLKPTGQLLPRHRYSNDDLANAVAQSKSFAQVLRILDVKPGGGSQAIIRRKIKELKLSIAHFTGQSWSNGKTLPEKRTKAADYLTGKKRISSHKLKQKLFDEQIKDRRCENCNRTEWYNVEIPLELHHIDGDNTNNSLENLQILCPNCHALTDNYRGKRLAVDH